MIHILIQTVLWFLLVYDSVSTRTSTIIAAERVEQILQGRGQLTYPTFLQIWESLSL